MTKHVHSFRHATEAAAILRPLNGQGASAMILDADLIRARRDRDFGRVEAHVTFLIKRLGEAVRPVTVYTNVDARGGNLRQRIVSDAAHMAMASFAEDAAVDAAPVEAGIEQVA